jgi:hypothetical protein
MTAHEAGHDIESVTFLSMSQGAFLNKLLLLRPFFQKLSRFNCAPEGSFRSIFVVWTIGTLVFVPRKGVCTVCIIVVPIDYSKIGNLSPDGMMPSVKLKSITLSARGLNDNYFGVAMLQQHGCLAFSFRNLGPYHI